MSGVPPGRSGRREGVYIYSNQVRTGGRRGTCPGLYPRPSPVYLLVENDGPFPERIHRGTGRW